MKAQSALLHALAHVRSSKRCSTRAGEAFASSFARIGSKACSFWSRLSRRHCVYLLTTSKCKSSCCEWANKRHGYGWRLRVRSTPACLCFILCVAEMREQMTTTQLQIAQLTASLPSHRTEIKALNATLAKLDLGTFQASIAQLTSSIQAQIDHAQQDAGVIEIAVQNLSQGSRTREVFATNGRLQSHIVVWLAVLVAQLSEWRC